MQITNIPRYSQTFIKYGRYNISTYTFGKGKKTLLLLPPFPHSGIIYGLMHLVADSKEYRLISLDIPGWLGDSENSFKDGFSYDKMMRMISKVISYYTQGPISLLGFSFGTSLVARAPKYIENEIQKAIFISPVINTNILLRTKERDIVRLLSEHNGYNISMPYLSSRIQKYSNMLKEEGIPQNLIDMYMSYYKYVDPKVVLTSLNELLQGDLTEDIKWFNNIPTLVMNSINESYDFILQADYIRDLLSSEKSRYISGSHEDFLLFPTKQDIQDIFDFLNDDKDS